MDCALLKYFKYLDQYTEMADYKTQFLLNQLLVFKFPLGVKATAALYPTALFNL